MLPTLEACSDVEAELDIEQAQALQQLESVNFQRSEIQMVVEGLQAELTLLEAQKATVSAELKEAKDGLARARAALEELPAKPGAPNDDR